MSHRLFICTFTLWVYKCLNCFCWGKCKTLKPVSVLPALREACWLLPWQGELSALLRVCTRALCSSCPLPCNLLTTSGCWQL